MLLGLVPLLPGMSESCIGGYQGNLHMWLGYMWEMGGATCRGVEAYYFHDIQRW